MHPCANLANPFVANPPAFRAALQFNKVYPPRWNARALAGIAARDNILFFGWQFASQLDVSSIGANFPPETKRLYQKYLQK